MTNDELLAHLVQIGNKVLGHGIGEAFLGTRLIGGELFPIN